MADYTDFFVSTTDLHCQSSDILALYPGADLSGTFTRDIDREERTAWFVGSDYISGTGMGGGGGNRQQSGLVLGMGLGL